MLFVKCNGDADSYVRTDDEQARFSKPTDKAYTERTYPERQRSASLNFFMHKT